MTIKKSVRQIQVSDMAPHVHSFKFGENKTDKLTLWLSEWIRASLKNGKITYGDFLPSKGSLAFHIGVSLGTIQNVFRRLEDEGLVESQQKIGTRIKNSSEEGILKLTSKRDTAINDIKNYVKLHLNEGDVLPSSRVMAKILNTSITTAQHAINNLIYENIAIKNNKKICIKNINFEVNDTQNQTLVIKLAEQIKQYINKNFSEGEKIPSNIDLAKQFSTSVKTIHDAVKILEKDGLVITKRGKYGTIVAGDSFELKYSYEKIIQEIKKYIASQCKIGDKLPSIKIFAKTLNVSTKTIKNALDILAEDGYITFSRGRNGGTFVTDIPQNIKDSYTWLALNPDYIYNIEPN